MNPFGSNTKQQEPVSAKPGTPLLLRLMQISGLVNHADWQANLQSLIVSPLEACPMGRRFLVERASDRFKGSVTNDLVPPGQPKLAFRSSETPKASTLGKS